MSVISSSFSEVAGHRLEVLQSPGTGCPVFLFHGNSSGAQIFSELLCSPLGKEYRLVACSLPGHGASRWSEMPAEDYSVPSLGKLLSAFVRSFRAPGYWLIGHSLGAHAIYEAMDAFDGVLGMIAVSAPPINSGLLANAFLPDPCNGAIFRRELQPVEIDALARSMTSVGSHAGRIAEWIENTDPGFREALGASIGQGNIVDEVAAFRRRRFPVSHFVGSADRYIRGDYYSHLMSCGVGFDTIVKFPECGHALQLDDPVRFESEVRRFLESTCPHHDREAAA